MIQKIYQYRLFVSRFQEYSLALVNRVAQVQVVSVPVLEKDCFGLCVGEGLLGIYVGEGSLRVLCS